MADLKINQLPSASGALVGTDLAMTSSAADAAGYTYTRDWDQVKAFVKAAFTASEVANVPAGNISATNVQAAINELDTEKVAKAGDNMTGQLAVNVASGTALAASQATSGITHTDAVQVLQSTDTGANGPMQALWHNSPTPAANDLIRQRYYFNDSLGNPFAGVSINARLDDPTDGSEDTSVIFSTVTAGGALAAQVSMNNGVFLGAATGLAQGVGTINATGYFLNGVNFSSVYVAKAGDTMTGALTINTSGGATPVVTGTPQLYLFNGSAPLLEMDGIAGSPTLIARRANGTVSVPTALQNAQSAFSFSGRGYGDTAYSGTRGSFTITATENWTDIAQGMGVRVLSTPNGSTTIADCTTMDNTLGLRHLSATTGIVAGTSATQQGTGTINAQNGLYVNGVNINTTYVALNGSPGQTMTGYLVVPVLRVGDLDPSDGLTTPLRSLKLGSAAGSVSFENETGNMFVTFGKTSTDANPAVARMNKSRGTLVPAAYLPVIQNDVAFRFDAVVNTLTGASRNTLSMGRNDMRVVATTPSTTDIESEWTLSLVAPASASLSSMASMKHATGFSLRGAVRINQNGVARSGAYGRTWQTATPTNGGTTVLTDYVGALLLSPAATIATHTLTMPADPVDGQEQLIKNSTAAADITALTINGNTGQTMEGAVTTLTAGQYVRYIYRGSTPTAGTWYRIG